MYVPIGTNFSSWIKILGAGAGTFLTCNYSHWKLPWEPFVSHKLPLISILHYQPSVRGNLKSFYVGNRVLKLWKRQFYKNLGFFVFESVIYIPWFCYLQNNKLPFFIYTSEQWWRQGCLLIQIGRIEIFFYFMNLIFCLLFLKINVKRFIPSPQEIGKNCIVVWPVKWGNWLLLHREHLTPWTLCGRHRSSQDSRSHCPGPCLSESARPECGHSRHMCVPLFPVEGDF